MRGFERIMVGMDGKSTDSIILRHIVKIKESLDIKKFYFVHITERQSIPDYAELKYPQQLVPNDKNIKTMLSSSLESNITDLDQLDFEILIQEGNPADKISQLAEQKQIDLLVLGRKLKPGITYFSRQLASQAKCSIMFVPKTGSSMYKKILVPIDYSRTSKRSLEKAFNYKRQNQQTEIEPVHFYAVPAGYSKSGKTYREYSDIMKKNAKEFFSKSGVEELGSDVTLILDREDNIAKKIFNYSLRVGADLIMIGSKARTKFASYIKGSIAAKLVEISYQIPVLIDKRKGGSMNALNAIIQI